MALDAMINICKDLEKICVVLSHWMILASFFEANWWHFTDPTSMGISIPATAIFLLAAFAPCVLLSLKKIRKATIGWRTRCVISVIPSFLLFIVTIQLFAKYAWVRTSVLAVGVAISPLLLVLSLKSSPGNNYNNYHFTPSKSQSKLDSGRPQGNASLSTEVSSKETVTRKQSYDGYPETIILVSILIGSGVRWCFGTINVFYESWQVSLSLLGMLMCLSIFICCGEAIQKKILIKKHKAVYFSSYCSGLATTLECDFVSDSKLVEKKSSILPLGCSGSNSKRSASQSMSDSDISSETRLKAGFDLSTDSCVKTPKRPQAVAVYVGGCIHGYALGTLLVLFLWLFSTPNTLLRWSNVNPNKYGIYNLLLFCCGIILSFLHRNLIDISLMSLCDDGGGINKCYKINQVLIFNLLELAFSSSLIVLLIGACLLQLQVCNGTFSFAFSGVCNLAFPCCLSLIIMSIKNITNYSDSMILCNMLPVPTVIAFSAGVAFCICHVILVLFIKPHIISAFLGRMDLILAYQVLVILISIIASTSLNRIMIVCDSKTQHLLVDVKNIPLQLQVNSRKRSSKRFRTPLVLCLTSMVVLVTAFCAGQLYPSNHCIIHQADLQRVVQSFQNRSQVSNNTFSVLTWNVLLGHDVFGKDNLPCLGGILNAIQPDIIGVEESNALPAIWGSKDILAYLAGYLGNRYQEYLGVHPLLSSLGVGFLAKLPVINQERYILPVGQAKNLPHYSLVRIDCRFNKRLLTIFNLHAVFKNWTATDTNISPFADISTRQMNFVADKIKALRKNQPVIVMGDFNLNPNEEQLDIFFKLGFKSALHQHRDLNPPSTIRNRFAIVDHVFYRDLKLIKGRTVVETGDVSDHIPILAYFQLPVT